MKKEETELATFAMGCFWKPDLLFSSTKGVIKTIVGYMGGDENKYPNPTDKQVYTKKTGYLEVVHIKFNTDKISFPELLDIFWKNHNPTTKNRQGPDIGPEYMSVIFYHNKEQKKIAEESNKKYQKVLSQKIITEIHPAKTFFKAAPYHQKFLKRYRGAVCY
ncbi:peptide-methionine (S)-S-oxide reductase [Candidatus Pacearchaeota archaeon CG10_big_fil_rev_8_21_14_0_10_34_76]|nr:MAG: peptide-methionine (S)-S-oxide reductase [Candidatus Pacearchaeota archaeon CG10_big_fil_rev_8_21_14_0_10_34_76]